MTIVGTSGNDTLAGTSGTDVINGMGGSDSITAGGGDDTIVVDVASQSFAKLDGGAGSDTLELHSIAGMPDNLTLYLFSPSNLTNIENIAFRSAVGSRLIDLSFVDTSTAKAGSYTIAPAIKVTGGDGRDSFYFGISGGMGNAAELVFPTFQTTNWTDPTVAHQFLGGKSDAVAILAFDNQNYVLRASEANVASGHIQYIAAGGGNDTLIGSSGSDNLDGGSGYDEVHGNGGDDVLFVDGQPGQFGPVTTVTDLLDGGDGTDYLAVSCDVQLSGTLVSIEGIYIAGNFAGTPANPQFDPDLYASLVLSSSAAASLPGDLNIDGYGRITIASLTAFDGSAYRFAKGADVSFSLEGTSGSDVIVGTAGNDSIRGDEGDDTLNGGAGIDTILYDGGSSGPGVTVDLSITTAQNTGSRGTDTISNFENIVGSAGNDTLKGNAADNVIEGWTGNDVLVGGGGIDTASYARTDFFGSSTGVKVSLAMTAAQNTGAGGIDTLTGFENLTGSNGDDMLTGNGGANVLKGGAGDDVLAGGAGNDTLDGGESGYLNGGDTASYRKDAAAVTVNLGIKGAQTTGGSGSDTLIGIENLTGSAFNDKLTGNKDANVLQGLAGNDALLGGAGNDTLSGGTGADTMTGGADNDTYYVDNAGDKVVELAKAGDDLVIATVSFTLAENVERLTLATGTAKLSGTGNAIANVLQGNAGANVLSGLGGADTLDGGAGADRLIGGAGADILTGGAGADRFVFDVLETSRNKDTITDFTKGTDRIELAAGAFTALAGFGQGVLDKGELTLGKAAVTASDHLIYNAATGALYYDADGSGSGAQVLVALIDGHPALSAADFVIA